MHSFIGPYYLPEMFTMWQTYFFRLKAKTFPILGRHPYFQLYKQLVYTATLPCTDPKVLGVISILKPKFIFL